MRGNNTMKRDYTLTVTVNSDDKRSMAHMLTEVARQLYEEGFIDGDEQAGALCGHLQYEDGDSVSWYTIETVTQEVERPSWTEW